ncbi:PLP-dependent aminotransferase family protein [Paenibacillus sp. J22TS3]|uniref:aminotransferase-like domain-containing protein n=1 Tax=Paenibacillus sp. J22TS3 TaxID=2807192 RepID=UPI001B1E9CDD|nr:PLP-dependent aminotransferase family protein [Paenibacillus sp. J22TS3]GIP22330.1 putative HTH-type transcriptional regulator YcxD [Paenibacillus sp. J22TS3]
MLKYMQLCNELENAVRSGLLKQGSKLPSIRRLAEQYQCSTSTILAALDELERRHMIYSIPRSGYYVVQTSSKKEKAEAQPIDFAASAPDPELFPYLDFQHCINKAIDTYRNDLFIYGTARGLPSLLAVMQKQLADLQVFTPERHMVVTSGVQQALAVLAAIPFPNGKKTVLMEQPGYHLFIQHLVTHQIPALGISRTAGGLDLDELEQLFRTGDIKFFYTTPRFHHPLGTSYTNAQKKEIVELAHKYDVYLVEDDYMADLEQDSKADPMYAFDRNEKVIYLKSYSKIIFPGLRVGLAVLPESLVEVFTHYKRTLDIDSSMLSQGALEIYLKSGMFERHKMNIRASYAKRGEQLAKSITQELPLCGGTFTYPANGYPSIHTHLVLHERISIPRIIQRMKKRNVLLGPIDSHYLPGHRQENLLKLNATTIQEADIGLGIAQLAEELRKERNRR